MNNLILKTVYIFAVFAFCNLFLAMSSFAMGGIGGNPTNPLDPENPGWFMYSLDSGEKYDDTVTIVNNSDQEWIVDLYPADSVKSSGGGFALKQKSETMKEIGTWVDLEKTEVRLKPFESTTVDFTISIPKNLEVGEYSGAILFEKRSPNDGGDNTKGGGVKINVRTGVRIYERVPGVITEKLTFKSFEVTENVDGSKFASSKIVNDGNISSKAIYKTTLAINGEVTETNSEFLLERGAVFENNYKIENIPYIGSVKVVAQAILKKADKSEEVIGEKEVSFYVIPWLHIAILLVIILLIIGYIIWNKRKYSGKNWVSVRVEDGDTLMSLAKCCNTKWETVAKVNKISAPYTVSVGQEILLPYASAKNKPSTPTPAPAIPKAWKKFAIKKDMHLKDIVKGVHHEKDVQKIIERNNLQEPYIIKAGQTIELPC